MNDSGRVCYSVLAVVAVVLLVFGFIYLLREPKAGKNQADVQDIYMQIKGFAMIMLAQVLLVVGGALCFKVMGGLKAVEGMMGGGSGY